MCLRRTMLFQLAIGLVVAAGVAAQETATSTSAKPLDVAYVSDDFFAALVVHPARLLASPSLKGLPLEEASKALKDQLGIEPGQVEQVMLLLPRQMSAESRKFRIGEKPPPMPLVPAGIVRFRQPVVNKELVAKASKLLGFGGLEQVERADKTYWKTTGRTEAAFYAPDERTLVFASERRLVSMVFNLTPGGRFVGLLKKANASGDVLVVVDPSAIREQFAELEREFGGGPEAVIGGIVLQVLRRVESYTFSADLRKARSFAGRSAPPRPRMPSCCTI